MSRMKDLYTEMQLLAAEYPERDEYGNVIGYWLYERTDRISGPYPSRESAESKRNEVSANGMLSGYNVVTGHVFTSRGTFVRELPDD